MVIFHCYDDVTFAVPRDIQIQLYSSCFASVLVWLGSVTVLYMFATLFSTYCSKMKMNSKKLSRFQFNFPGLLGTSLMSKQFFFYNWTLEIIPSIHLGKQMEGT